MKGPDLRNSLFGVLKRFREEPIANTANMEKMFYQVRVPEEDIRYLRFLWWPGGGVDKDPEKFQMLVSSPSCASYAFRRKADDNAEHLDDLLKWKMTYEQVAQLISYVGCSLKAVSLCAGKIG